MELNFETYIDNVANRTQNRIEFNYSKSDWKNLPFAPEFKIRFQEGYQYYINTLGTGIIFDFIWILNPFSKMKTHNLFDVLKGRKEDYHYLMEGSKYKFDFEFYPHKYGLIPFARTENGDYIYWQINGFDETKWPIIILDSEDQEIEKYDMSFDDFIKNIRKNEISSKVLTFENIKINAFRPLDPSIFN